MSRASTSDGEMRSSRAILSRLVAVLLALDVLSGCTVGPNYRKPVVPVPNVYHGGGETQDSETQAASYADLPWWEVFQDPVLQDLIQKALAHNYDLQLATERISSARAQLTVTRSDQFPQATANVDGANGEYFQGGFPVRTKNSTFAADATFQLDLFGGLRRATEAARAELLGTQYAQKTEILTLVSDAASDYFALLALDLQLQVTQNTIGTQQDAVRLTNLRMENGVATILDVLQAQQVLDIANAQVPELERQIGRLEDAISILVGDYPHAMVRGLPLVDQPLPPEVPAGLPSSLLARRPDIFQAEQNLIAANAEIGVARAAFFPQIGLTGSAGGAVGRTSALATMIDTTIGTWAYGLNIAQPIFEGGKLRGNLRLAHSEQRQQLIAYQQTIQSAFRDVSDALIDYDKYHKVRLAQEVTVTDLQQSVNASLMRYRGGIATYLEVLDAQRSLYNAQLTLAQARGKEYQSVVQLYKSLGGGWQ